MKLLCGMALSRSSHPPHDGCLAPEPCSVGLAVSIEELLARCRDEAEQWECIANDAARIEVAILRADPMIDRGEIVYSIEER